MYRRIKNGGQSSKHRWCPPHVMLLKLVDWSSAIRESTKWVLIFFELYKLPVFSWFFQYNELQFCCRVSAVVAMASQSLVYILYSRSSSCVLASQYFVYLSFFFFFLPMRMMESGRSRGHSSRAVQKITAEKRKRRKRSVQFHALGLPHFDPKKIKSCCLLFSS